ncbi:hypothetical protein R3P38DRAFT_2605582 [Favolaschia claudopus]|uniref:Oxidase ustYa n=1 Tax=Favolaschia claudopus TaxID=2862362 RepID=A0AAW0DH44_9AGAR
MRFSPRLYLASAFGVLSLILSAVNFWSTNPRQTSISRAYSYIGNDFPEFYIPKNGTLPRVLLTVEESRHYALSGPDALEEWASNSPVGYGYLRLGPEYRAFDMAMFHETHCLHALRIFIERADRLEPHVGHCLNYLRMFILCNPNLTLEPADVLTRDFETDRVGATHVCPNWEVLYREMEENWDEWKAVRDQRFPTPH